LSGAARKNLFSRFQLRDSLVTPQAMNLSPLRGLLQLLKSAEFLNSEQSSGISTRRSPSFSQTGHRSPITDHLLLVTGHLLLVTYIKVLEPTILQLIFA